MSLPGSQRTDDGRGPFFRREEPLPPRVGFGQGLSPQGAALRTISTTIENTRRTIPSLDEIRERFILLSSARRDEAQRATTGRTERSLTRRVESRIPEASAQARNFISSLNEAAGLAQARLEGIQPDDAAGGPTIQINGEQFGFGTSENEIRLDIRV